MTTLNLNGNDYDIESLNDEAKIVLNKIIKAKNDMDSYQGEANTLNARIVELSELAERTQIFIQALQNDLVRVVEESQVEVDYQPEEGYNS